MNFKRIIIRDGKKDVTKTDKEGLSLIEVWKMVMHHCEHAYKVRYEKLSGFKAVLISYEDCLAGGISNIVVKGNNDEIKLFEKAIKYYIEYNGWMNESEETMHIKRVLLYSHHLADKNSKKKVSILLALGYEIAEINKTIIFESNNTLDNFYTCLELSLEYECSFMDMALELASSTEDMLRIVLS